MTGEFKRKLDLANNASIDLVALNNQVVKMRAAVKRSKLYIINKLSKKIKKFRYKKGTEDQKKQNNSKADNLVKEIKVIQVLKPDYISKYALGTTEKFEKIICQPNLDMERRALARLAEHEFIQDIVKKFRETHDDWKDLTAYLMTKHTSREFKKKKSAQRLAKVATNVRATEKIVETYLGDKLKDTNDTKHEESRVVSKQVNNDDLVEEGSDSTAKAKKRLIKETSETRSAINNKQKNEENESLSSDDRNSDSDSEIQENYQFRGNRKGAVTNKSRRKEEQNIDCHDDGDKDDNDVEEEEVKSDNEELSDRFSDTEEDASSEKEDLDHNVTFEEDDFETEQKLPEHLSEDRTSSEGSDSERENKVKNEEKDTFSNSEKFTPKQKNLERLKQREQKQNDKVNTFQERTSGEMIVKKLNLEEWTEDSIDTESSNTVPEFLMKSAAQKTKRKVKDPFFCTSDDEEFNSDNDVKSDDDNSDLDANVRNKNKDEDDSDISVDSDSEAGHLTGIRGLSTTFLGSLNSGRMMKCDDPQYRSNDDWKKVRQDKKNKLSERNRGRGRGRNERSQGHLTHGRDNSSKHKDGRGRDRVLDKTQKFINHGSSSSAVKANNLPISKTSTDEKLLRPSYLTQSTTAPPKPTQSTSPKTTSKEEKLHPSWQASKKRKEQQSSMQQFQGKKIKFDD